MFKFIFVLACSLGIVHSALDTSFCDPNTIDGDSDNLQIPDIVKTPPSYFSANIQKISDADKYSEDYTEHYSYTLNKGYLSKHRGDEHIRYFISLDINEVLILNGDDCDAKLLDQTDLSPFYVMKQLENGQKKLVSPLTYLFSNPNIQSTYIGSNNIVKGKQVKEWVICYYDVNRVQRITYSFADANFEKYKMVPVQILYESKYEDGSTITEYYSIFQFSPQIDLEQNLFTTPEGVYCDGRKNTKELPSLPYKFELSLQFNIDVGSLDFIENIVQRYDFHAKLYSILKKTYAGNTTITEFELHDFNTGIRYITFLNTGQCVFRPLAEDGVDAMPDGNGKVRIRTPKEFFDLDDSYQYTGTRRIDGVDTDVWIGKISRSSDVSFIETHFLSESWKRNDTVIRLNTPIRTTITQFVADQKDPTSPIVLKKVVSPNHFYDFRESDSLLLRHDLSGCKTLLDRKKFSFHVAPLFTSEIKKSQRNFEIGVVNAVSKFGWVVLTRVSGIEIYFEKDSIYVYFELYEKEAEYGNVNPPENDVTIIEAVLRLTKAINENKFSIDFYDQDSDVSRGINVDKNSFKEEISSENPFYYYEVPTYDKGIGSIPVFIGVTVATLVGILLSILVITLHKFRKIKLPFVE